MRNGYAPTGMQVERLVLDEGESNVLDSIDTAKHLRELAAKFFGS